MLNLRLWLILVLAIPATVFGQSTRMPKWDARGGGPLPRQGVAALDVNADGTRVVVGTTASPGEPNVLVLDHQAKLVKSFRVGQRWIGQVVAAGADAAFALCTMTTGAAGDEPQAYFCHEQPTVISNSNGGTSLFHYGDHSNHVGKQIAKMRAGVVTISDGQLLWAEDPTPRARASLRNLRVTALAAHASGVAVVGGYVDPADKSGQFNLMAFKPGEAKPLWQRAVLSDVGDSQPPEAGQYGAPIWPDGQHRPLPQRDEPIFAPLSIAVSRDTEFDGRRSRVAVADYRGWRRWIRSSGSRKEEEYGTRFMPAKPTVTVYDGEGQVVRRFGSERFATAGWVDLLFSADASQLIAVPHRWTCRGLARQSFMPVDDPATALWLLEVESGDVRTVELPDAVASVDIDASGRILAACWNGTLYAVTATGPAAGQIQPLFEVGEPAIVVTRGQQVFLGTPAGRLFVLRNDQLASQADLQQLVPPTEKPWVKTARATPLAKGLWQLPGGRVESDLGGQRLIEGTDGLILIEAHAGLSFESEWAAIEAAGLDPHQVKYVLTTHEHGDHSPGAYLWRVTTGAQFVCSREMAYVLQHHLPGGTGYGLHPPVPTDIKIDDDTVLDLAGVKVAALRLPGHTFGSMGWLFQREDKRFVAIGDLIMPDGVLGYAGSINFSPYQVLESLRKLDGLRVDTILPGHGPVVGPDKYVLAGIEVGTRVGWGKMKAARPDPRFRLTQDNVLVAGFLSDAVSAAFGDVNGDGTPDAVFVAPRENGSVAKIFLNQRNRATRFQTMQADFEIDIPAVSSPSRVRLLSTSSPLPLQQLLNEPLPAPGRPIVFVAGQSQTAFLVPQAEPGQYAVRTVAGTEPHQARILQVDGVRRPVVLGRFSGANAASDSKEGAWITQPLTPKVSAPYVDILEQDLNGDGRSDRIASSGAVWLRPEPEPFSPEPSLQLPLPVPNDWTFLSIGDFNGDRRPDVALVSYGAGTHRKIRIFHNTGDVRSPFPPSPSSSIDLETKQPHVRDSAAVGDWNADGIDDLVIALGQDNQVRVFLGAASGLASERVELIQLDFWLHYEHAVTLADFNDDGRLDLGCFGYTRTGVGAGGPPAAYLWLQPARGQAPPGGDLREALTFHANFDGGTDAVTGDGDRRLYSAASYKPQDAAQPGLKGTSVVFDEKAGRVGGALRFTQKNTQAVFYKAAGNVPFDPQGWTGTIAFWLSLDPESELANDYCDPIQVTDKTYNDAAIWVDFTKDERPRQFRLGVFGDLKVWNPRNLPPETNPAFLSRLVVVKQPPFAKGKWTHVAIVHEGLGAKGKAALYVNGKLQGQAADIREPFTWDPARATIRLGMNYTGLFDDLMIFRRALSDDEIARLADGKW